MTHKTIKFKQLIFTNPKIEFSLEFPEIKNKSSSSKSSDSRESEKSESSGFENSNKPKSEAYKIEYAEYFKSIEFKTNLSDLGWLDGLVFLTPEKSQLMNFKFQQNIIKLPSKFEYISLRMSDIDDSKFFQDDEQKIPIHTHLRDLKTMHYTGQNFTTSGFFGYCIDFRYYDAPLKATVKYDIMKRDKIIEERSEEISIKCWIYMNDWDIMFRDAYIKANPNIGKKCGFELKS